MDNSVATELTSQEQPTDAQPGHVCQFAATEIPRHPVSRAYRVGLVGVAIGLLALPVIYFGIVAAVIFGLYYHLTHDFAVLADFGFKGLVLYVGPGIIGAALIWFLVRPFFVRKPVRTRSQEITAEAEPVLFEFVQRICDLLRAPRPRRVFIDLQPNASASIRGFIALLRRELNLTIGLPLVSRLTVAQFGGVLAHEFGHFAQGTAMRFSFLIRTFNDWVSRVAFQPQVIEQKMSAQMRRGGLYGMVIGLGLRIAIWITRQLLHRLLLLSHAISCYSMRQMEYDADMYEAKVAGSEAFVGVTKSLRLLAEGYSATMLLLQHGANDGRASIDLVEMIKARSDAAQDYEAWHGSDDKSNREHWFDTHPSPANRIKHINSYHGTPAIRDDRRAPVLFADFTALCRTATRQFYEQIGLPLEKVRLQELAEFCRGEVLNPQQIQDLNRFFANRTAAERPVTVDEQTVQKANPDDLPELITKWNIARQTSELAFGQFVNARARRQNVLRAQALKQAGVRFAPGRFGLASKSKALIALQLEESSLAFNTAEDELRCFDETTDCRLAAALKLSCEGRGDFLALVPSLNLLREFRKALPIYRRVLDLLVCLGELLNTGAHRRARTKAAAAARTLTEELENNLKQLQPVVDQHDPILGITIEQRIVARSTAKGWPREHQVVLRARECLSCISTSYYQHLATLCRPAAAAEDTLLKRGLAEIRQ